MKMDHGFQDHYSWLECMYLCALKISCSLTLYPWIHLYLHIFSLDLCCSIADISELVVEAREISSMTWKLKWFSEESPFKFVALLKAIHAGLTLSPLLIRCTS
ncbi:hypothetical protein M0R45_023001 [Rubus argutus]|uniref:Uncharacterized protein n=1 Tax=Rubus argutus TaxID=59490 RepID=A0AAW1WLM4_RUBAR